MGFGGYDYATLSQNIAGITAGQVYFLTVQVSLPSSNAYCSIQFSAGSENLVSFDYGGAQNGAVNASGIFRSVPSSLALSVNCNDWSGSAGTINTWIAFDNVQLSVYNPSAGTNPIRPVRAEGVVNNDFSSGSISPWVSDSTTGRMDFNVVDGAARMTFSRIVPQYNSPAWIYQLLNKPSEETQNVRITADVYIYVSNGATKCTAQIRGGQPVAWTVSDIATSQGYRVDVSQTLTQGSNWFYLYGNCQGTGSASYVAFDNVHFSMNDF